MVARKKYPDELRQRAAQLALTSGRPVRQVANDLGVHPEALRTRVRQAKADRGERPELLTTDERQELALLRRENAELRRANEILKAASPGAVGAVAGALPSNQEAKVGSRLCRWQSDVHSPDTSCP
jgi:transposase